MHGVSGLRVRSVSICTFAPVMPVNVPEHSASSSRLLFDEFVDNNGFPCEHLEVGGLKVLVHAALSI
jgi:hypothetical protein